eukprot:TRINITY_DN74257_c0_g1_i1.p1 TRINITY_DN74257_c0_g1~~TRINITY_DN74257_c0_g1_i1.p1  ORF type:complete len:439 (-),score=87.86 TRINITY_DN74257_c0_g1_i1:1340-2656(-)
MPATSGRCVAGTRLGLWLAGFCGIRFGAAERSRDDEGSEPCGCEQEEWITYNARVREVLQLNDTAKYTKDFDATSLDVLKLLYDLSTDIFHWDIQDYPSLEDYNAAVQHRATGCPAGVATAAVLRFAYYAVHVPGAPDLLFTYYLAAGALGSLMPRHAGDGCLRASFWVLDTDAAIQNLQRFEGLSAAERARGIRWAGAASQVTRPECSYEEDGVDACCEGAEWKELENSLRTVMEHPRWIEILPTPRDALAELQAYELEVLPVVVPWLQRCRTGHAALAIVYAIADGKSKEHLFLGLVSDLLGKHSLQDLAASRFPILGLLAYALERDASTSDAPACQEDMVAYLHAVIDGAVGLDRQLLASLFEDLPAGPGSETSQPLWRPPSSLRGEVVCGQQKADRASSSSSLCCLRSSQRAGCSPHHGLFGGHCISYGRALRS